METSIERAAVLMLEELLAGVRAKRIAITRLGADDALSEPKSTLALEWVEIEPEGAAEPGEERLMPRVCPDCGSEVVETTSSVRCTACEWRIAR